MSQSSKKSLIESIIQTFIGTISGFILTMIIFPLFGIHVSVGVVSGITIVFMFFAVIRNYFVRRLFNWMHTSDEFKWWDPNQSKYQSLFEGVIQTLVGTLMSFLLSVVIYPMFGIDASLFTIGEITVVFMVVSVVKNYFVRRYFENIKIVVK